MIVLSSDIPGPPLHAHVSLPLDAGLPAVEPILRLAWTLERRAMGIVSRGFRGRRPQPAAGLIPPGQYVVDDFPVLTAGPTPITPLDEWDFSIVDETGSVAARWTWDEFRQLPAETPTVDIHCVTKWSKFDTRWEGVSVDTLLDGIDTSADYVTAFADGG